jgi:hypothetical protein
MFHYLTTDEKRSALPIARRLLRPGGSFHIADLGPPRNDRLRRLVSVMLRRFGASRLEANLSGRIPALMREAGFAAAAETNRVMTPFGRLVYWNRDRRASTRGVAG